MDYIIIISIIITLLITKCYSQLWTHELFIQLILCYEHVQRFDVQLIDEVNYMLLSFYFFFLFFYVVIFSLFQLLVALLSQFHFSSFPFSFDFTSSLLWFDALMNQFLSISFAGFTFGCITLLVSFSLALILLSPLLPSFHVIHIVSPTLSHII